ncbi:MAG: hypothetical protein ACRDHM_02680 [Actinomycetota bacterium]
MGTVTNAVLLLLVGGLLSWQLNGRFKALEARMDTLQRSVDGVRSDLTQVALAVGTKRESGAGT